MTKATWLQSDRLKTIKSINFTYKGPKNTIFSTENVGLQAYDNEDSTENIGLQAYDNWGLRILSTNREFT